MPDLFSGVISREDLLQASLPSGEHDITMRFEPTSYKIGERVSRASSILLILLTLLSCGGMILPNLSRARSNQTPGDRAGE